jgi:uncharacterized protein YhfF
MTEDRRRTISGLPVAEFGFPGPLRDQLVSAVLAGKKTASTGLVSDYEREGEPIPRPGERFVMIDSAERPLAILETTEVRVLRAGDVDEAFARDEGEDFESVGEWRAAHERFFHSYADETRAWLGDPAWTVTDETMVVAERFRLVQRLDR